jgi:putative FmdB family regulatory protein
MPTYVYHCSACEETYEVEQRITEEALTDCRCGSKGTLKRVIQPVAVAFKGSGFHINDYAAKPAAEPKSESSTESKTESKTETKSETTETKAEAPSSEPASAPAPAPAAAPKTD